MTTHICLEPYVIRLYVCVCVCAWLCVGFIIGVKALKETHTHLLTRQRFTLGYINQLRNNQD